MKTITIQSICMLLLMFCGSFYTQAQVTIPTNNLVFEYKFENNLNETSGSSLNAGALTPSGNSHTFVTGSTPNIASNTSSAVQLGGDNLSNTGNVTFSDNVKLFTLSFWIKVPNTFWMNTTILEIKDPNSSNKIKVHTDGALLYIALNAGSFGANDISLAVAMSEIQDGNWHNITLKGTYWTGGGKYYGKLFFDGVFKADQSLSMPLNNIFIFGGTDITIGNDTATSDVQIDNLRFYKEDITDAEITDLYNERNQLEPITSISIQGQGGATAITTANGTLQMEATVLPASASQNIVWSVDNTTVATINANGELTGVGNGTVIVNAVAAGNSNFSATKNITVSGQAQQASCTTAVHIPDGNFRAKLFSLGIDANNDGTICEDEAQAFAGTLDVSNLNILDLTGIEAFTGITTLDAYDNNLTSINVSTLTYLARLHLGNNKLEGTLDISGLANINQIFCYNNKLTGLNVANGNNANFVYMKAYGNQDLTCIQKDVTYTPSAINAGIYNTGWTKDSGASYSNNCGATAGISDAAFANEITVYPNPVRSSLFIEANSFTVKTVTVFNVLGKKVLETNSKEVNVSELVKGLYLVKIESTDGKIATKKIIKK